MARRYAIQSRAEALAYLAHDLLGARLVECTRLVLAVSDASITDIMGRPDDMKFRSSMTLFHMVSRQDVFANVIRQFFPEGGDPLTIKIVESQL